MGFADSYFQKYKYFPAVIDDLPDKETKIIVIIPCFDEPEILKTLSSLLNCESTIFPVEIITLINSSQTTEQEIINNNRETYTLLKQWCEQNSSHMRKFFAKNIEDLPSKFAGAGLARKIAMDEALRRFNIIDNPKTYIVSLDADTLCAKNYLSEIEQTIVEDEKINGFTVKFEHQKDTKLFSKEIIAAISLYELHLHYYINSLRYSGFPYSFHTIGSAFGVNAMIYAKQGGMNTKQAGEDFYFLHKIIPLGNFCEITCTCVYPSPRISTRVPFGTGISVANILKEKEIIFKTYNFTAFKELKMFFSQKNNFFKYSDNKEVILTDSIKDFLEKINYKEALININQNSTNLKTFEKRFFQWFDAFCIVKYLNFAHEKYFTKNDILLENNRLTNDN